ncbi:GNAT family N-acetyltransferase [Porphyrobacter sp. GA68]|uniref:GNAT family N-acetyltransferase n=1 Tax=Porphyrobacter sp. GA68 TaxID=2883480 RepID=UPI001D18814B|nr:GNAT family N-acetyltransferase [Porphyrobacter sp. GA68]
MTYTLRPASMSDVPDLARLGRASFVAAFGHLYDDADLASFLREVYAGDVIAREVCDPTRAYRLAWDADRLVAFCKLYWPSPFAHHSDAANPICLGQLYADPACTGQGVGALLMDWALEFSRAACHDAVQLSVYCDNTGAQRFYARHGFRKIADVDFWVGSHRDDEYLYELRMDGVC